jgi:hypothetical protein
LASALRVATVKGLRSARKEIAQSLARAATLMVLSTAITAAIDRGDLQGIERALADGDDVNDVAQSALSASHLPPPKN